jgi:NitT/TauT family transport system ATP-binding protein
MEAGKTVFFVTHDIEESLILADRILVVSHGRLVEDIAVDLPRPRTEEVRASDRAVAITRKILDRLGVDRHSEEPADLAPSRDVA